MIRVLLADDHHLVREGLRALLDKAPDIEVVGEAEDGQMAVELVQQLAPDVLVIDISMPRLNGIHALERVRALQGSTATVILSMYSDESLVKRALRKGAQGYLLKRSVTEELLLAVRAASRGDTYLSPPVSRFAVEAFTEKAAQEEVQDPYHTLTRREREVLQLVAEGNTNKSISQILGISVKTVEKHRASLTGKLDVHSLPGLVRVALKHGLIFLE